MWWSHFSLTLSGNFLRRKRYFFSKSLQTWRTIVSLYLYEWWSSLSLTMSGHFVTVEYIEYCHYGNQSYHMGGLILNKWILNEAAEYIWLIHQKHNNYDLFFPHRPFICKIKIKTMNDGLFWNRHKVQLKLSIPKKKDEVTLSHHHHHHALFSRANKTRSLKNHCVHATCRCFPPPSSPLHLSPNAIPFIRHQESCTFFSAVVAYKMLYINWIKAMHSSRIPDKSETF